MSDDLIEKQYLKIAEEQAHLFMSMARIMESDFGEDFTRLVNALTDGFKENALFSDDSDDRLVMRGAVVGLNTLLSQMVEFSARAKEIGEDDVGVEDMVPKYATVIDGDDEL